MAMPSKLVHISIAEYLAREEQATGKHEYVDGRIFAMSGSTRRHNLIAARLLQRARSAADERTACQVFGSDMKLLMAARNSIYYPDLTVSCDPSDCVELYLTRPCFIVEVLSPSTASIDRREKRMSYQTLESLREYVIIDQDRMRVEVYQREDGLWQGYLLQQPDDTVRSTCLGLSLTLAQIYEDVELPTPGVEEEEAPEYAAVG